jgi:putative spermidine/putrescine transport system ATP-binding protein
MTAPTSGDGLSVESVTRIFGTQRAVDGISFDVRPGELVALVGASGSGKTTTLRMVAGYEIPDAGAVRFGGADITRVPPSRRDFGMVFQHYALFPHMTVVDNVAFGLEARGVARAERRRRAMATLESVGLGAKGDRGVQQLSGGEQQRVALARALVIEPRMLLLDEPLSNLDPTLRQSTREDLRATLHRVGAPALFVTHDQDDAFAIADRVVLLARGRVLQIGTPEELYRTPASRDVATFIGRAALIPARRDGDRARVTLGGSTVDVPLAAGANAPADGVIVARPESIAITMGHDGGGWRGAIQSRRFAGASFVYQVALADDVTVETSSTERLEEGAPVTVRIAEPVAMVA